MRVTEFGLKYPVWISSKENPGLGEITKQANKRVAERNDGVIGMKDTVGYEKNRRVC